MAIDDGLSQRQARIENVSVITIPSGEVPNRNVAQAGSKTRRCPMRRNEALRQFNLGWQSEHFLQQLEVMVEFRLQDDQQDVAPPHPEIVGGNQPVHQMVSDMVDRAHGAMSSIQYLSVA